MGNIVKLEPPPNLTENQDFVADMCRYTESILTEAQVKKKWRFNKDAWDKLGEDEGLVEKIEAESARRIRDGSSKREKSQLLVVKAPDVLSNIMMDDKASPRHRVDAIKVLDVMAANGPQGVPPSDRFIIQINMGDQTVVFDKPLAVDTRDSIAAREQVLTINEGGGDNG